MRIIYRFVFNYNKKEGVKWGMNSWVDILEIIGDLEKKVPFSLFIELQKSLGEMW